jgi:hypothetical protein
MFGAPKKANTAAAKEPIAKQVKKNIEVVLISKIIKTKTHTIQETHNIFYLLNSYFYNLTALWAFHPERQGKKGEQKGTKGNCHDTTKTKTTTRQKTNFAHFSNSAPQPPTQFRLVRPPFRYPENDHTGGFETRPYRLHHPSAAVAFH